MDTEPRSVLDALNAAQAMSAEDQTAEDLYLYVNAWEQYTAAKERVALRKGIRGIRKRLQLTQSEMAARLGIDHTYLSKLETGPEPLSVDLARKILAMHVSA